MLLFLTLLCSLFGIALADPVEENFLVTDGRSGEKIFETGPNVEHRITPCSTFKIVLSLIGFETGILQDEQTPVRPFQEGYDAPFESWRGPQTPESWIKNSCVWYSKLLTTQLGPERFQFYVDAFGYGNLDLSGGLTTAWLGSSLKISLSEQVAFIRKMGNEELPVSKRAVELTKKLLFLERLSSGGKLFGKTGTGSSGDFGKVNELGWLVGWMEREDRFFPFAYQIRNVKTDPSQRIARVKRLLNESGLWNESIPPSTRN